MLGLMLAVANGGLIADLAILAGCIWVWSFVQTERWARREARKPIDWKKEGWF